MRRFKLFLQEYLKYISVVSNIGLLGFYIYTAVIIVNKVISFNSPFKGFLFIISSAIVMAIIYALIIEVLIPLLLRVYYRHYFINIEVDNLDRDTRLKIRDLWLAEHYHGYTDISNIVYPFRVSNYENKPNPPIQDYEYFYNKELNEIQIRRKEGK